MSKTDNKSLIVDIRNNKNPIKTHLYSKMNIPSMYNIKLWGNIKHKKELNNFTLYSIIRGNYRFEIAQTLLSRNVSIFDNNNNLILEFIDKFVNDKYFIRTIKRFEYHFINDKLICSINKKDTKFINNIEQDNIINENIITLDIETKSEKIADNDQLSVISCCNNNNLILEFLD